MTRPTTIALCSTEAFAFSTSAVGQLFANSGLFCVVSIRLYGCGKSEQEIWPSVGMGSRAQSATLPHLTTTERVIEHEAFAGLHTSSNVALFGPLP